MLFRVAAIVLIIAAAIVTQTDIVSVRAQQEKTSSDTSGAVGETLLDGAAAELPPNGPSEFLIAGGDGYGATECLATASQCGQIVADAWCESKGYAKSFAYRRAAKDETTASVHRSNGEDAFVITCSPSK